MPWPQKLSLFVTLGRRLSSIRPNAKERFFFQIGRLLFRRGMDDCHFSQARQGKDDPRAQPPPAFICRCS